MATRRKPPVIAALDTETLNSRLLAGHRLITTLDKGRVVACHVLYLDDPVSVQMFNSYLSNGLILPMKDGEGYGISPDGRKRLK